MNKNDYVYISYFPFIVLSTYCLFQKKIIIINSMTHTKSAVVQLENGMVHYCVK